MANRVSPTRRGILALATLLPGCGFQPIYARGDAGMAPATAGLAEVSIGLIPERPGQLLRQALQARFERGGTGLARRYDLRVDFGVSSDAIGIQPDSSVSRIRMVGTASWTLTAQNPQRSTLATGTSHAVDGFNIFNQQLFTSDLESEAVQRRIAEAVADQITLQLAIYFNRHGAEPG